MTTREEERAELLQRAIRLKKAAAGAGAMKMSTRPPDQPARLGEMQRSLWLVHQMDRHSPAYNLTSAFRIHGALDVSELQRAWNEVVSRHRLLRSTFRADRDTVLQIVHPHAPLSLKMLEVGEGEGLAAVIQEARRPFDLETGPLLRLRLISEPPGGDSYLLLVLHHILADERSLGFLWKEMAEAYDGRPPGPEPRVQYDDYVHWHSNRDKGQYNEDLDYWRRRLDPFPESLRLPFEKPAAVPDEGRGKLLVRALNEEVQSGVRRLASETGTTPFVVFAFAFRLLLHRYTRGLRMAFATPVSTRSHPDSARMIGYFTNPVVINTPVDEGRTVGQAIREYGRSMRNDLAHSSLSFQELVEEVSPPRERDRHPVFQVMFVYQEAGPIPDLGEARLEPVTLDLGESKFDLTLFVSESENSIEIAVEYRTDRFDDFWMSNLLCHYETLVAHMPNDLERATAEVEMMGGEEQGRLRARARGPELDASREALAVQQIVDQARHRPESRAVTWAGVHRTYAELTVVSGLVARELSALGVKPGDRVAVFLARSDLMIAGLLGCQRAGAAYVPMDPSYPQARNQYLLDDAEVAAVLTTSTLRDRLPEGQWPAIDIDDIDNADRVGRDPDALPVLEPEDPAYILYTSGSTGHPKGVVVTHDNLRASTVARMQVYDRPPKRFLLIPSIAFDSSIAGIFWTLAAGGALVVPTEAEAKDPRLLAKLVAEEDVTHLLCVPSLYAQMLRAAGDLMKGLDTAIVAGESCSSRLVEEHFRVLPHARLYNEYGPTEATVWATVHEVTKQDASRPVAIGRPIPGARVDVLDELGRQVPTGIPGQAWIAGPTVARGYWRRPDLSKEQFVTRSGSGAPGHDYRTGDLMAWTSDERLLFLGREDEQIKLRGYRIEPGEIEAALLGSPGIEDAAVVARPPGSATVNASDAAAAQLVAFVQAPAHGDVAGWRRDLPTDLPAHMVPSRLVRLDELPRLPNGKVDRRFLREMELDPEARASESRHLLGDREQTLVSLWEGLLGRSGIGLSDNFFELGGHSLLVVEMTLAIERDMDVTLSAADVFENPTVSALARRIEQRGGSKTSPYQHLFPIQPGGHRMPFIVAVPHFFTEMFAQRFRGERPVYGLRGVSLRPEGNRGRWRTMTDLAEEMVGEIHRRFPGETIIMAGYSFGASMAIEAVRVMEKRGIPAHRLYLIAPMPMDFYRFGPFRVQLDALRKPVEELTASEALRLYVRSNSPFTSRPYRRAWRWITVQPWRRLLCLVGRLRRLAGLQLTPRILHADVRVERFRLHGQYRAGSVDTPTVIFNAQETDTDAAATWRPYFRGPLTVIQTPDPHLSDASVEGARRVILRHLNDLEES